MEKQMKIAKVKRPKGIREQEQRLTRMMALIFGTFLLTYFPGVTVKLVPYPILIFDYKSYVCFFRLTTNWTTLLPTWPVTSSTGRLSS